MRVPRYLNYLQRWTLIGLVIGVISGLGAVIFYFLLNLGTEFFLGYLAGFHLPFPAGEGGASPSSFSNVRWWLLALIPGIGGLISGFIVYRWAPEAEGHGTDAVITAFHRLGGAVRGRIPIIKTIASVATIGSGGSAGREGPIAQIGAGFASWLASRLKMSVKDRRLMVVCGTAAGIGSIFKAPLGGAIFAIEVLYKRDLEVEALVPAFISSVVAYAIFSSVFGFEPIFRIPELLFTNPVNLIFYGVLGLISGALAILYVDVFYGMRDKIFRRIRLMSHFKPALGGLMLGGLILLLPQVAGTGYGWLQMAIYGQLAFHIMILIALAKIIATSFTISSGGSGGVFAPSLVIGGMTGGVLGKLFSQYFPSQAINIGAFVLVGMAAFFAGAAKVPVASIVMVSEMTGGYHLLVPLMLACAISYIVSGDWTIYENQVEARIDSPAHREEFSIDILEEIEVGKVATKKVITVSPEQTLREVSHLITSTGHLAYPVLEDGKLIGLISYRDILKVPSDLIDKAKVREVMSTRLITATPNESLAIALRRMDETGYGHLPVVNPLNPTKLLGILSKRDIIRGHEAYKKRIIFEHIDVFERVRVEEVMRRDFRVIEDPTVPIASVAKSMVEHSLMGYLVIEDGKIGILDLKRVLKAVLSDPNKPVSEVIDERQLKVHPEDPIHKAVEMFHKYNIDALPVVDEKRPWKIMGILTLREVVRAYELKR